LTQGLKTSCGCKLHRSGSDNARWKGCGDISASLYHSYKSGANRRGLDFNITIEQLWDILTKQHHKCAITGVSIKIDKDKNINSASPDRINPNEGYCPNNIQWVHKTINQMKWNLPQDEFVKWCRLVSTKN